MLGDHFPVFGDKLAAQHGHHGPALHATPVEWCPSRLGNYVVVAQDVLLFGVNEHDACVRTDAQSTFAWVQAEQACGRFAVRLDEPLKREISLGPRLACCKFSVRAE